MAPATMRTFYGDVPLDARGVPILQFDKADVLIKLGDDPVDRLLLHSSVLSAASPVLKAGLDERFADSKTIEVLHPGTGGMVKVKVLALTIVDDTYMLEGMHVDTEPYGDKFPFPFEYEPYASDDDDEVYADPEYKQFHASGSTECGWPTCWGSQLDLGRTRIALRWMFALFYGTPLSLESLGTEDYSYLGGDTFLQLSTIGSYAKYYGCVDLVSPPISEAMRAIPELWELLADEPSQFVRLAGQIWDTELYSDAFRHCVAQAHAHSQDRSLELPVDWDFVAFCTGCDDPFGDGGQAQTYFAPQTTALDRKIQELADYCTSMTLRTAKERREVNGAQSLAQSYFVQWALAWLHDGLDRSGLNYHVYGSVGRMIGRLRYVAAIGGTDDEFAGLLETALQHQLPEGVLFNLTVLTSLLASDDIKTTFSRHVKSMVQDVLDKFDRIFAEQHHPSQLPEADPDANRLKAGHITACKKYNPHHLGYIAYFTVAVEPLDAGPRNLIAVLDEVGDLDVDITAASAEWITALQAAQPVPPTIFDELEMEWEVTDRTYEDGLPLSYVEAVEVEQEAELGLWISAGLMSW